MAIKKVQLPDNSTQDINDSRIGSADITKWNGKEDKSNKVTSLSSSSTDTEYPSAKAVFDALQNAGGKQYRLIASGTVASDAELVRFSTDTNGDPFELTEVLVYARIRGNSAGYTGYSTLVFDNGTNGMKQSSGPFLFQFATDSNDPYYTILLSFRKVGTRVLPILWYRSWNNSSLKDSLTPIPSSSSVFAVETTNANFTANIKRISMGGYNNGGVGAGSEYWVYGIDA